MKPQSSKAKGRKFQQQIRDLILQYWPTLQPDDVRSTSMGSGGEDVQLSPAARLILPYQIECKAKARAQVYTWYEQAKEHGDYQPLVFIKQDRHRPLVVLDAEHFLSLLKENEGN